MRIPCHLGLFLLQSTPHARELHRQASLNLLGLVYRLFGSQGEGRPPALGD